MKLLILGGKGMAGHVIKDYFMQKEHYEVLYTSRDPNDEAGIYLDVTNVKRVEEVIELTKPDVIINCIGLLNGQANTNPLRAFQVNSLLPHQLAKLAERHNGKLIQISTDCVFSGLEGDYTEDQIPDGTSVYAQSKQLGEIVNDQHLTIRTSIIGPELKEEGIGLFLWFMNQSGEIKGYEKVLWNGVTTLELAKAIEEMIHHRVTGLYHLGSSKKVSKYELLMLIRDVFQKNNVKIVRDQDIVLDRTIKSTRTDFEYIVPSYEEMLISLREWMKKL
ncbi:dTDP-4-dehydrorhamnose reductase family protein [Priestia filamentosa]|uniref:dTDP-4-dehydrorhamnose reductase family protein n=1 Tax=Priestia filamentosa TaxID=1402861 RepID=UPI00397A1B6A